MINRPESQATAFADGQSPFYANDECMTFPLIRSLDASRLDDLCARLEELARSPQRDGAWPAESLRLCGEAGVYAWFLPVSAGGLGWDEAEQTRAYLRLAAADLTTTFVITQRMTACRRVASSENCEVARKWLPKLVTGEAFATVGISHLTTSRQHLGRPVLQATAAPGGWWLDGFSPWVTGGSQADLLVVGATLEDGRQIVAAVDADQAGVAAGPNAPLVALSGSCTGQVDFCRVAVTEDQILSGPVEQVLQQASGKGPGGLQTSALAIGLADAAARFLQSEALRRKELTAVAERLTEDVEQAKQRLLAAAKGMAECDAGELRGAANRLVLRATQAALTAAKGAGFVAGHPVGRWCCEALFFLVWSCPQPVAQSHLCELAGLATWGEQEEEC